MYKDHINSQLGRLLPEIDRPHFDQLLAGSPQPLGRRIALGGRTLRTRHTITEVPAAHLPQRRIDGARQLRLGARATRLVHQPLQRCGKHAQPAAMPHQLAGHDARMHAVHRNAAALQHSRQLAGEQHVGQLALTVGRPAVVAALAHQILAPYVGVAMRFAGNDHDATGRRSSQPIEQQIGEQKVAEMVDAQVRFEAVHGARLSDVHDAGIVDEHIEAGLVAQEAVEDGQRLIYVQN